MTNKYRGGIERDILKRHDTSLQRGDGTDRKTEYLDKCAVCSNAEKQHINDREADHKDRETAQRVRGGMHRNKDNDLNTVR